MHRPRKRFGQNFLIDPMSLESLVKAIAPCSHDLVLEIGPGKGALTSYLLEKLDKLEVIELDRDLISYLEKLSNIPDKLKIHQGDALEFDFSNTDKPRRIVGNLPYNISTPLIFHLLDHLTDIQDMHFMLQKEVVDRICAQPGDRAYGRLAVMIQTKCSAQKLFDISPENFNPQPKVQSSFIRLIPLDTPMLEPALEESFSLIVKQAFSQPRKTIANNLKGIISAAELRTLNIDPTLRPQHLNHQDYLNLAQYKRDKNES